MIQYTEFNFNDRIKYVQSLPQNGIYLVSDIKSKKTLQENLLETHSVLNGNCVQRAQDFYASLFLFNFPDWKIISAPALELIFKSWRDKSLSSNFSISSYLQSFLPFLTHPEGSQIFEQWVQENSSRKKHIQSFKITQEFWKELKKLKRMEESCIKYALTHQEVKTWDFELFVDLGFSIDSTEIEIFKNISKQRKVSLLVPPQLNSPVFQTSHKMYTDLEIKPQNLKPQKNKEIQAYRFQNVVHEVQFITHQIRKNLDSGIPESEISIIAPRIEGYWPCLKTYLTREGIPFTKETPSPYLSFPQIQKWLSAIRLHLGNIHVHSLEETYFYKKNMSLSPETLRSKYKNCHRPQDLNKDSNKKLSEDSNSSKKLPFSIEEKSEITTQEFIQIIFDLWEPSKFQGSLNSLLSEFFFSLPLDLRAQKEFFIQALESFLSQKNVFQKHYKSGIRCLSLNALTSLQASHIYLIGLDHSSCQKTYPHVFNENEVQTLMNDLGFYCSQLEPHQYEYEITNLLNLFKGSITLSYSETQLNGTISQPSRVWYLEYKNQNPPPSQTVLNSIQKLDSIDKILNHSVCAVSHQDIKQNLSGTSSKPRLFSFKDFSLSPSKIKNYADCPFIFFSKDVLKLDTQPDRDVQLSPLDRGRIIHELLQEIIKQKLQTPDQIQECIDDFLDSIQSNVMDPEVLNFYKKELYQISHLFLQHEKEKLQKLPQLKTIGTEIDFKGYWDLKNQEINLISGDVEIKGRIDRIDQIDDQLLIIDYKSNLNSVGIMRSWANKNDVQMPIYIQTHPNVAGAVYLSFSDFEYKGYIIKSSNWSPLLPKGTHSLMDKEKTETILEEINQKIQKYIEGIQQGNFAPNPHNVQKCNNCKWNQICRAKHL